MCPDRTEAGRSDVLRRSPKKGTHTGRPPRRSGSPTQADRLRRGTRPGTPRRCWESEVALVPRTPQQQQPEWVWPAQPAAASEPERQLVKPPQAPRAQAEPQVGYPHCHGPIDQHPQDLCQRSQHLLSQIQRRRPLSEAANRPPPLGGSACISSATPCLSHGTPPSARWLMPTLPRLPLLPAGVPPRRLSLARQPR